MLHSQIINSQEHLPESPKFISPAGANTVKRLARLFPMFLTLLILSSSLYASMDGGEPKIKHVLLISVDGMHAIDLTNYVASHPNSTLAHLSAHGVTFDNASTSQPSDSFPGLASLVTGGSPTTTGFWYDVSYNRKFAPPALTSPYVSYVGVASGPCPGTTAGSIVEFDESVDADLTKLNGGGSINPGYLPRDPQRGCTPVYPHEYLRVNTIFEVVKSHGGYTAWTDKHPSYEWTKGPSGKGVDDFYGPEINSIPVALPQFTGCSPVNAVDTTPDDGWTTNLANIRCYDSLHVQAVLNQIKGLTHDGSHSAPIPTLFGTNFQAVSVGQKLAADGYTDVLGTPSDGLTAQLDFVDQSLGSIVNALVQANVYDKTLIIVGAKHGQSPIDHQKRVGIGGGQPATLLGSYETFDISDDGSLIWLTSPSQTASAVSLLSDPASQQTLGIQEIFAGSSLKEKFNNPVYDERTPDIVLKTNTGVIFTGGSKIAEHGGLNEDDLHVALLVSMPGLPAKHVKAQVLNQQVAPTIIKALGLNPSELDAVRIEGITSLPFLF
jgi:hypothetical protein